MPIEIIIIIVIISRASIITLIIILFETESKVVYFRVFEDLGYRPFKVFGRF